MTIAAAVMAVVGFAVGFWLRPGAGAVTPDSPVSGDEELGQMAVGHVPSVGVHALSIAAVTPEGQRTATVGAPLDGTFEIGSITKGVTGLLYADMVERGEVRPETRLGDLLDLGDADAADITLEELSQQRSGLPRLGGGLGFFARTALDTLLARNPYAETPDEVVDQVRAAKVGDKEPVYSNLGYAVLGHALASAAGTTYPELVAERIAEPLGLSSFTVPLSPDQLADDAVQGRDRAGRAQQAWADEGFAPAGGIRASAADMATLAQGLLDQTAPGVAALDPQADFGDGLQIGAAWFTEKVGGRTVTWHNGGTGGFRSWFGMDREHGVAVYLAGATTVDLDEIGFALLRDVARS
ncbi:class A beta-lactamase-related serine hydrolase [Aeromicrobium camelliae]|uniref:Class A beta-lactamase-related serine hydrolase n=2 Tax=Aeromicrobium camelliae TaxID=1538144 RepID=A0A3N6W617_9ACTN|nr:class A beta-lactamase-related serine hydrolase [Aeromicrobium camelliae]